MPKVESPYAVYLHNKTYFYNHSNVTDMPVNKNALIRYKVLDRCFSNPGKKYFIDDLVEECNKQLMEIAPNTKGVQKRQLFEDIKYMESSEGWSADIQKILFGKKKFYRYRDKNFSISNQPLNASEIDQLHSAIDIIQRFKGMPQFEWINEFTPKLEQAFTLDASAPPIISFDNNEYLKGVEYIGDLFNAILYKKVIKVKYRSFKSDILNNFIIHPYYLKQYNNRWFLFGHNEGIQKLTNLALDRIQSIEDHNLPYSENDTYDFNEYFEDIIGVTKPDNGLVEKIVLKFSDISLPYILSKPLHGSQKVIKDENEIFISIEVIPNYELESLLLSFGERIKIISPNTLKDKIRLRLNEAVNGYV